MVPHRCGVGQTEATVIITLPWTTTDRAVPPKSGRSLLEATLRTPSILVGRARTASNLVGNARTRQGDGCCMPSSPRRSRRGGFCMRRQEGKPTLPLTDKNGPFQVSTGARAATGFFCAVTRVAAALYNNASEKSQKRLTNSADRREWIRRETSYGNARGRRHDQCTSPRESTTGTNR